jgi:hypothetical protein
MTYSRLEDCMLLIQKPYYIVECYATNLSALVSAVVYMSMSFWMTIFEQFLISTAIQSIQI